MYMLDVCYVNPHVLHCIFGGVPVCLHTERPSDRALMRRMLMHQV